MALVHDHAEAGDMAQAICLVFMAVVLVAVLWSLKPNAGGPLALATVVGLVLVALATIGSVSVTGHSGAKAAWADVVSSTTSGSPGSGESDD
jgi:di/tricarboxylate transporter